jgi:polyisoprenoid-binding protein YceI
MRNALLLSIVVVLSACPDPAKDKVKATVSAPSKPAEAQVQPIAGAAAYPFTQADSKVSWTGAKVTGKHEGGFNVFGGIVELVDNDVTKSRVRAEIDMSSIFSDSEKLTGHLKSPDFFAVEQFPQAKFTSTALKLTGEGSYDVTGDLTLHGVTKSISFPAKITAGGEELTVNAEFAINRKDFGIVYPGKPDDLIADNVALKLELHAKKKAL